MISVRLEAELEAKLKRAAQALDTSQSDFIRDAVSRRCDEVLTDSLANRLAKEIGIVESTGGRAAKSGSAFRRILGRRHR